MTKDTLSDKITYPWWVRKDKIIRVEDVKEFIKEFEEYMNKKFLEEKEIHQNHRVLALLLDLRAELAAKAGGKLV